MNKRQIVNETLCPNTLMPETPAHKKYEEVRAVSSLLQNNPVFKNVFVDHFTEELLSALNYLYISKMGNDANGIEIAVNRIFAVLRYEAISFNSVFDEEGEKSVIKNRLMIEKKGL